MMMMVSGALPSPNYNLRGLAPAAVANKGKEVRVQQVSPRARRSRTDDLLSENMELKLSINLEDGDDGGSSDHPLIDAASALATASGLYIPESRTIIYKEFKVFKALAGAGQLPLVVISNAVAYVGKRLVNFLTASGLAVEGQIEVDEDFPPKCKSWNEKWSSKASCFVSKRTRTPWTS
ncbi:hypothetical protein LZ554_009218 [Drepanopeziza brunnea f. sp. 'monogermtubi']|nr:hypothetical protein LZ554_009218 [Drepanopeziza brunnea f. sp. 'monogermtubi']